VSRAGTAGTAGTAGRWLRRHRGGAVVLLVVLATLVLLSVATLRSAATAAPLDPDNPSVGGARAVGRVLSAHGVAVQVVRDAAALDRAGVDRSTTVLVTSSDDLGAATARRLARRAAGARSLVLAEPGPALVDSLDLPLVGDRVRAGRQVPARCDDPLLGGLRVDPGPAAAGLRATTPDAVTCFPGGGPDPASLVARLGRTPTTYALAAGGLLRNDRVDRADNAAAVLRLLGQGDRLLWYVPDPADITTGDSGSLTAQLPGGLVPALWLLALAALATMLWRGRRLGPLVVEPLPVVVKAVESTRGRGRLYRRVRDRQHAATVLQRAATRRLAARLRLPADHDPLAVAEAVAAATATDVRTVTHLLTTRDVPDDATLTRLARDLAGLEREVHRP
jgi:hypothetical protein